MSPNKSKSKEIGNDITSSDKSQFPIVGIGASAGGLEALEQFFENMPDGSGMAYVVIQHLDPTHVGIMPELLQRITTMKVFQATDGLKVKPECVYVIPPNKSMSLLNGALHLFVPVETRGLRLPVDVFFSSLALDKQDKSIGVILSGMGSDGSLGAKAIKHNNGIVLVQTPASAKFDGMPRSAIEAVHADIVAPAYELPGKLIDFLKSPLAINHDKEIDHKSLSNLDKIIILIREQTGHDFSLYKKNTLFRRIERRKGVHQIDKLQSYVRFCQENPNEIGILYKELLIGVTNFFRDIAVWEKLKEQVLPAMINELPYGYTIRAWVTACSTGEEAYSLAIIFKELLEKTKEEKSLSLQIFATDIDLDAIEKARKGVFNKKVADNISPERLSRFFVAEGDGYRINASIREMVVFAPQNVIKDPPFTKLDILTCRNMLIYMEPELQKKLIALFSYSLNPGGIMTLGTAETLSAHHEGFKEIDTKLKIFKRTDLPLTTQPTNFPSSSYHRKAEPTSIQLQKKGVENIQTLVDQHLIQYYVPASVMINDKGDVIYMTGRIGKYLEPVAGKANYNIYVMAREGLRNELPGVIRKAMQKRDEVILQNIKIESNGNTLFVDISVQLMENPDILRGMVMIVFIDTNAPVEHDIDSIPTKKATTGKMKDLENQLQRSNEDLQGTREEMQTSQEELKSTNEELQSTNEELQSNNEELTTSKEEMQSLNEELQTVNAELQSKVTDFVQASDDMKNLLNSTGIATLFLDRELNIRRFTEKATKIFNLRNSDIGRPFTDLTSDLKYPEIRTHTRQVLDTLISIETEIPAGKGNWFSVCIMPYRTLDDRIDGLVITFTDITAAKSIEANRKISEIRYRSLFESAKDGILILDAETGKIQEVNPYLIEMFGYSKDHFIEKYIWQIGIFKDIVSTKDKFLELNQKELVRYENLTLETANGRNIKAEFVSNVYEANNEKVMQCFIREIIDRKK